MATSCTPSSRGLGGNALEGPTGQSESRYGLYVDIWPLGGQPRGLGSQQTRMLSRGLSLHCFCCDVVLGPGGKLSDSCVKGMAVGRWLAR